MVEAGFLYVGSQGILWSADHNKSIYARICIDITLRLLLMATGSGRL
jgi:hypothetical protein